MVEIGFEKYKRCYQKGLGNNRKRVSWPFLYKNNQINIMSQVPHP